jgi:hypothetical protein
VLVLVFVLDLVLVPSFPLCVIMADDEHGL